MNIAIYVKAEVDIATVKKIKDYFIEQDYTANVFIANDNIIQIAGLDDFALVHASSIDWLDGKVIFTSVKDYKNMNSKILGDPMIVLKNKESFSDITPEIVDKCDLLLNTNTKIRKVKNAELQSIIRNR